MSIPQLGGWIILLIVALFGLWIIGGWVFRTIIRYIEALRGR